MIVYFTKFCFPLEWLCCVFVKISGSPLIKVVSAFLSFILCLLMCFEVSLSSFSVFSFLFGGMEDSWLLFCFSVSYWSTYSGTNVNYWLLLQILTFTVTNSFSSDYSYEVTNDQCLSIMFIPLQLSKSEGAKLLLYLCQFRGKSVVCRMQLKNSANMVQGNPNWRRLDIAVYETAFHLQSGTCTRN